MARAVSVPIPLRAPPFSPWFNCFSFLNYLGRGHDGARLRVTFCADEKVRNDSERLGHVILFNMPVPTPLPFSPPLFTCFPFSIHMERVWQFPTKGAVVLCR